MKLSAISTVRSQSFSCRFAILILLARAAITKSQDAVQQGTVKEVDTRQRVLHVDAEILHDDASPFIEARQTLPPPPPPTTPPTQPTTASSTIPSTTPPATTPSTTIAASKAASVILLPLGDLIIDENREISNVYGGNLEESTQQQTRPSFTPPIVGTQNENQEVIYGDSSMKPIRNFTIHDDEPILHTYNTGDDLPWAYRMTSNSGDIHCHFCNSARDKRCGEDFDEAAHLKNCRAAMCTDDGYLRFTVPYRKPFDENEVSVENDEMGIFPRSENGNSNNNKIFSGIRCPEVFTKCRKIDQSYQGKTTVIRTCGWLGGARTPSQMRSRTSQQVRFLDSECYQDGCNAAARHFQMVSSTLLMTIFSGVATLLL